MKKLISKRLTYKLVLDLAMLAVLTLLYNKHSISLTFHEAAGLALLGAMALHLALNHNWIILATRRYFRRGASVRTRIVWAVDVLLLVAFVVIGLSGILISRVLFSFGGSGIWRTVHYFTSACALILIGIHLGLHAPLLAGICKKHGLNRKPLRIIGSAAAAIILIFGCYRIESTNFTYWLSMPFSTAQGTHEKQSSVGGSVENAENTALSANDSEAAAAESRDSAPVQVLTFGAGQGKQDGTGFHGGGEGTGTGNAAANGSAAGAIQTIASFFSILFVFACLTAAAEQLLTYRKKQALPPPQRS